jgi:hypothetical protein
MDEDVVPDAFGVSVAFVPERVDVASLVDDDSPVVVADEVDVLEVDVVAEPLDDSPDEVELAELVEDDSEDVPVVSAAANP